MTVDLSPEQERLIQQAMEIGRFRSVEDVLGTALTSLLAESEIALERSQLAGQRIRELRKGVTLDGLSLKELIEEGRE